MTLARLAAAIALGLLAGCGLGSSAEVAVGVPQALVTCASIPDGLAARLWISNQNDPCPLEVDVDKNETSGICEIKSGTSPVITLDWYAPSPNPALDDLLLAQVQKILILTDPPFGGEGSFSFTAEDIATKSCLDMRENQTNGADSVKIDGEDRQPCDVDDSCELNGEGCSNVEELCAGTDPFDALLEP